MPLNVPECSHLSALIYRMVSRTIFFASFFLLLIFPPTSSFAALYFNEITIGCGGRLLIGSWQNSRLCLGGVCSRMRTFDGFPLLVIVLEYWNGAQAELIYKIISYAHLFWNMTFTLCTLFPKIFHFISRNVYCVTKNGVLQLVLANEIAIKG